MRRFIAALWNGIPPGVAIAVLTIPAFILPFFWEHLAPFWKGTGISTVVLLVALEISVIYRERARQDQSFLAQITKLDAIRSAYDAHSAALAGCGKMDCVT